MKKLIVHIPVKNRHTVVERVAILCRTNLSKSITLKPRGTEGNMFEVDLDVRAAALVSVPYFYEYHTCEKGFIRNWKESKTNGYFLLNGNPVQRDILQGFEFECIGYHLSDIIFFPSGISDSEYVRNSINEIDILLSERELIFNLENIKQLMHFLFETWFRRNSAETSLLLLVVLGKLLKNSNVAKQVTEIDEKTSLKLLQDIKKFRLVELPQSCEGYMVELCLCLCEIHLRKKFCLLLFMDMCFPFLDTLHMNEVVSNHLKYFQKIQFVPENSTHLIQTGKELCSTLYTLHLSDNSSKREQSMKLLNRLLLHLPIAFLPPIMEELCCIKEESLSPSEEAFRKELNETMINSMRAEVQKTSKPSDLYKVWSLVRPVGESVPELKDSLERKVIDIIKYGKHRDLNSDIKEVESLFSDMRLFNSRQSQYLLLTELAESSIHVVQNLFIYCLELKKFAEQKENICALSLLWLSRLVGKHATYKSCEILVPYKAVSRLLSIEIISTDLDTKSSLCEALFKQLQKHNLNTVLWQLGDDTELPEDKYISDVFLDHVAELIKEKYELQEPDEMLQRMCGYKNLVINSRYVGFFIVMNNLTSGPRWPWIAHLRTIAIF